MLDQIQFGDAVKAVLLFGSQSRGDAVAGSDTDIAVFAEAKTASQLIEIKRDLVRQCCEDQLVNFSLYSIDTAEAMALQGSLYLWHLKLEGKPLLDRKFLRPLFDNLRPYTKAKATEDLETFAQVLSDMDTALTDGTDTLLFEAATAFSILRSLGMMLGALNGQFTFSRVGPVYYLGAILGNAFPFTEAEICALLEARLSYSGKACNPVNISIGKLQKSVCKLIRILEEARQRLK